MQLKSTTIDFVKQKFPSIPVPHVICTWVDQDWNRSFELMKTITGTTLLNAWDSLDASLLCNVAKKIAAMCKDFAAEKSDRLCSTSGGGILEPFLGPSVDDAEPAWKPQLLKPLATCEEVKEFHFYNADLGPSKIMVSVTGGIVAILDWESGGYYPRFGLQRSQKYQQGSILEEKHVKKNQGGARC